MKWIVAISFLLIVAAGCTTVFFVSALKPTSAGVFLFFVVWLVIPCVIMSASLVVLQRKGSPSIPWCVAVVAVSAGGIFILADSIFWHPDAQGAIAVLMTPLLQDGALAALAFVTWLWVSRND